MSLPSRETWALSHPQVCDEPEEMAEDLSKAIVSYRHEGGCQPHIFSRNGNDGIFIGSGTFGAVFMVECALCHGKYAKKVITFHGIKQRGQREKQIKDTDRELRCYMDLDHPNILAYVHHELDNTKIQIYTEYCELQDLATLQEAQGSSFVLPASFPWLLLEGLASALSRCHYGLKATQENGLVCRYTELEKDWRPILHRDIKPGNILVAVRGDMLIPKLGDFGTCFKLDGVKPPSSLAGTRAFWAPEIKETFEKQEGRIARWSKESDIWAVGAVLHDILAPKVSIGEQDGSLDKRVKQLNESVPAGRVAVSKLLARVISECLDPNVNGRPSALQLLAVSMKLDTTPRGLQKSESFWRFMAIFADPKLASTVVTYFVTHLPLMEKSTVFNFVEITLIMSLAHKHCRAHISQCHRNLCSSYRETQEGEWAGSTAFHIITYLPKKDEEVVRPSLDESTWLSARELAHWALQTNKAGLLPSALAALRGKKDLCIFLARNEESARKEDPHTSQKFQLDSLRKDLEALATKEFEFMFSLLTRNIDEFIIPPLEVSKAMIGIAQHGFSNMTRKLVELGINPFSPSIRGKRSETVLHIFAYLGNTSMVCFLIQNGVPVDVRDVHQRTPLHWAAWAGKEETVNALLSRKADVNARDYKGRTALYGAVGGAFADVVRRLLSRNADITIPGGAKNEMPLETARRKRCTVVIDLLSQHENTRGINLIV